MTLFPLSRIQVNTNVSPRTNGARPPPTPSSSVSPSSTTSRMNPPGPCPSRRVCPSAWSVTHPMVGLTPPFTGCCRVKIGKSIFVFLAFYFVIKLLTLKITVFLFLIVVVIMFIRVIRVFRGRKKIIKRQVYPLLWLFWITWLLRVIWLSDVTLLGLTAHCWLHFD